MLELFVSRKTYHRSEKRCSDENAVRFVRSGDFLEIGKKITGLRIMSAVDYDQFIIFRGD